METARPYDKVIIAAGLWLLATAFLWRHVTAPAVNMAVVGALCVVLGALALRPTPRAALARYLVTPVAAWLFLSPWVLHAGTALLVANVLVVASVLLGVAMLPIDPEELPHSDRAP